MPIYRIAEWNRNFENNRTRDLKRMEWVPIPNRMDGEGYTELVDHPSGAAHFGAWIAIVEIASRRKVRGTLPHGGSQSLARMSQLPAVLFDEVIPRLLKIGWLLEAHTVSAREFIELERSGSIPQEGAGLSHDDAEECLRARAEWNGMERNGMEQQQQPAAQSGAALLLLQQADATDAKTSAALTVGASALQMVSEVVQHDYPVTLAEIRKRDPSAGDLFARRLMQEVVQKALSSTRFPRDALSEITDESLARCVAESYRTGPRNHGTGLLLTRVPNIVETWALED